MSSPSDQTLLITGANGFVAGLIVRLALGKGYKVRGSVRSESSAVKLKAQFPDHASQLSIVLVPDITNPESFKEALDNSVTGVIHTASPFSLNHLTDIRAELLDPAVGGAVSVLEATRRYGSNVRRVVTTASFASQLDMLKDPRAGYTYTEADWNPMSYDEAADAPAAVAYCASKAIAEKAQWTCMRAPPPRRHAVYLILES